MFKLTSSYDYVLFGLFLLYLFCSPLYFLPSGVPQLADIFMALLLFLFIVRSISLGQIQINEVQSRSFLYLLAFYAYTLFVSLINGIYFSNEKILIINVFYLYNTLVFLFVVSFFSTFHNSTRVFSFIRQVMVVCVFFQIISSFFIYTESIRSSVFFNNPNQLGYFSICALSIYFLSTKLMSIKVDSISEHLLALIMGAGCLYLSMISLSKAAMVSIAIIFIYKYWKNPILWAVVAVTFMFGLSYLSDLEVASQAIDRLVNIGGQSDDGFSGRGYDRIWNHPYYLLLGAGEGGYDRFISMISGYEIHSSWGTLLFSYGIWGFTLFCLFLISIFRGASISIFMYVLPLFMYSITHQGLRSTLFWIVLALAYLCKQDNFHKTFDKMKGV
jgi:hypothetical protein